MAAAIDWTDHFKRQNCVSAKIARYLAINLPLWSNIVNNVLQKCVTLMVAYANNPNRQYTFGPNNYKYYSRSIISQWTSHYHYPSIDFENRIEIIHQQFAAWIGNPLWVGNGPPPDWNIFTNLKWSHALSLCKSLSQYILIKDIPENSSGAIGVGMPFWQFDNNYFFNIREFTHKYLGILRGPAKNAAYFNQGTIPEKKRKGIGYINSRLNKIEQHISGWDHSGPTCKEQEQAWMAAGAGTNISPFSRYIFDSIPNPLKNINNLPIQCSISGSTNLILSTLLWGTEYIILTKDDACKIILGIIALLGLDGGHTMQEVLTASCLISNFYRYFINNHVNRGNITCFNNTTIENLHVALRNLEFLPKQRIIDQLGGFGVPESNAVLALFQNQDLLIFPNAYPDRRQYEIFVCNCMIWNEQDTANAGWRYFTFWTDTFEYMNLSLILMINSTPEYSTKRAAFGDGGDARAVNYNAECYRVCNDNLLINGGIASSKNTKNKKLRQLRSPLRSSGPQSGPPEGRLLRSPRRSRGPILGPPVRRPQSGPQHSFGSPRAIKYSRSGSPKPLRRSPKSPRRSPKPLRRSPKSLRRSPKPFRRSPKPLRRR